MDFIRKIKVGIESCWSQDGRAGWQHLETYSIIGLIIFHRKKMDAKSLRNSSKDSLRQLIVGWGLEPWPLTSILALSPALTVSAYLVSFLMQNPYPGNLSWHWTSECTVALTCTLGKGDHQVSKWFDQVCQYLHPRIIYINVTNNVKSPQRELTISYMVFRKAPCSIITLPKLTRKQRAGGKCRLHSLLLTILSGTIFKILYASLSCALKMRNLL